MAAIHEVGAEEGTVTDPAETAPDQPPGQPDEQSEDWPDGRLWAAAAAGDRAAFGDLFERHMKSVWNYAYRLTGSWSLAEDLTASTFLTAWRRRAEVTLVRDSALPWLYAVAANLARGEQRRSSRFLRALRRSSAEAADEPDHADAVVARVTDGQRVREVLAAIRALPPAEREVVELCLLGELSTADAAQLLGISPVGVRTRISRARGRLRGLFEEES